MIFINGESVDYSRFPDGTLNITYDPMLYSFDLYITGTQKIKWQYQSEDELIVISYIVNHLKDKGIKPSLFLPYVPNARMDRVKADNEVFTLKWFSKMVNDLGFESVSVLDPHSNVCPSLLNHVITVSPEPIINHVLDDVKETSMEEPIVFYPDEGSCKRYSGMVEKPYLFGTKNRDWETGEIIGLDVHGNINISGSNVVIIDDICSRGGTFLHSAKKLKELGAKDIYLYVTHCEDTILDGDLINSGLIKRVYTTDSIDHSEDVLNHLMIEILPCDIYEYKRRFED